MNKLISISINEKSIQDIINKEKMIEIRKDYPDFVEKELGTELKIPFKVLLFQDVSKNSKKIIGEFMCNRVDPYFYDNMDYPTPSYDGDSSMCEVGDGYWIISKDLDASKMTYEELLAYGNRDTLYGWHISDFRLFDEPIYVSIADLLMAD